jgi:hypothetical protein
MISKSNNESVQALIVGWYDPSESHTLNSVCVVEGCGRAAAFKLCPMHAVPGLISEIDGDKRVVSSWIVERNGAPYLIPVNDWALGAYFGNRENFEEYLRSEGYVILEFVSTKPDPRTFKFRYPGILQLNWRRLSLGSTDIWKRTS